MTRAARTPWCCRHRWTLRYIAVVVTVDFILQILTLNHVI